MEPYFSNTALSPRLVWTENIPTVFQDINDMTSGVQKSRKLIRQQLLLLGLPLYLLAVPRLAAGDRTVLSPDLQNLWEQTYNEPGQILNEVRTRLAALNASPKDEQWAILNAIGAEAASFAEKNEDTFQLATAAEKLAEEFHYYWPWVHAVSTLGVYYEFDGKDPKAKDYYQRGVQIARESEDPELLAYALNNVGYYYGRKESAKEAIQYISQALRAMDNQSRGPLYYDIINNLAVVYTRNDLVGRMDEGRRLLEQSFAYFKSRNMRYMMGNNYINLGLFHKQMNEVRDAIGTFKEAIEFSRKNHIDDLLPYYLSHLGDIYIINQQYIEALQTLDEAEQLFRLNKNNAMLATCLLSESKALVNLKRPKETLSTLKEYKALLHNSGSDTSDTEVGMETEINAWHQLGDAQQELLAYRRWGVMAKKIYDQKNMQSTQQIAGLLELERREAENKLLEEKNRTSAQRLEQADRMSRILMGLLASFALLLGFMLFSLRQSRVIRLQRNRMRDVLNNIEEGIVRFGKDFRLEAELSAHLAQILETDEDITGQDVFAALFQETDLSDDFRDTMRAALSNILEEGELAWSLNSGQLPMELHRRNRILNLLWQPHYDRHQRIDKIMLVIRDVTSSKVMEAEIQASRLQSQTMTHYLQEMLQANGRSLERFMNELDQDLSKILRENLEPAVALRHLHTMKGSARGLGLVELSEAVHRLESLHKNRLPLDQDRQHLMTIARQYQKLFREVFRSHAQTNISLLSLVDEITPALMRQLDAGHVPFGSIAIIDEVGRWPRELMTPLRILLLHGLSNAVDHGYVLPQKIEPAMLVVEAARLQDRIRLCIRDAGRGIAWQQLERLAAERGFKPKPDRPLTDLLFVDGVSTSQQVTISSGRGVGLAAVQEACRELAAEVTLLDNDQGPGSMLIVDIPRPGAAILSA